MFEKQTKKQTPSTVDEAAQLLLSDLMIQHLQALSEMTEGDFDMLCEYVTPYLIEEFKLWQGNDALLASCFNCNQEEADPARIIMNRVKDMLSDLNGLLIIT